MPITHDYLNTSGYKPTAAEADVGELIPNLADGTLWSKNTGGTVIQLGSGGGDIARQDWHFVATASQTAFTIVYDNVDTVDVYIDGVLGKNGLDYTLSGGTTVTLLEPAVLGTLVDVFAWNDTNLYIAPTAIKTELTVSSPQTIFTVSYNPSAVDVYSNGVLLLSTDYTASNGTSITLNETAQIGDVIRVNSNDSEPQVAITAPTATDFTATAGQTVFIVNYNTSQVEVYADGIRLKASEYTASNGTSITLNSGVDADTWIHVISNQNSPALGMNWGQVNGTPTTLSGYGITDAGTMSNVVEDTTPQLGGTLDAQGNDLHNVGVVIFDGTAPFDNGTKTSTWAFDPMNGQYQKVTIDAAHTITITAPSGPGTFYLHVHQGATGGALTLPTGKWVGGTPKANTLTATTGHDLLMVHYYGGTSYVFEYMLDLS